MVENERIVELPLQGRQVTDLILLAGAAVQTGQPNTRSFQGGVNIAVAGGQGFGVAYLLDGAMHNDPSTAAGLPLPFPDALQEFRLATSGLSADNGIHSGASVNAVTKSGTNRFHGNGFEFYRDRRFNATNVFAPIGPDGRRLDDGLHRNQFGGTWGRLSRTGSFSSAAISVRSFVNSRTPTSGMCRRPRCWPATLRRSPRGGLQQRGTSYAAGAVHGQPHRSGTLQSRCAGARPSLPKTTDPCGEIRFPFGGGENIQAQTVVRADFQRTADDSIFARYMATTIDQDIRISTIFSRR